MPYIEFVVVPVLGALGALIVCALGRRQCVVEGLEAIHALPKLLANLESRNGAHIDILDLSEYLQVTYNKQIRAIQTCEPVCFVRPETLY